MSRTSPKPLLRKAGLSGTGCFGKAKRSDEALRMVGAMGIRVEGRYVEDQTLITAIGRVGMPRLIRHPSEKTPDRP